jgi:hypothetical protein
MTNRVIRLQGGCWMRIGENLDSGWRIYGGESAEVLDLLLRGKLSYG